MYLREVEFRLDKEGKEFHHYEHYNVMYKAEVSQQLIYYQETPL